MRLSDNGVVLDEYKPDTYNKLDFPEVTLSRKYGDYVDQRILMSKLIQEIYKLPCIIITYIFEGNLYYYVGTKYIIKRTPKKYINIDFFSSMKGYIEYKNEKYVICWGAYIGSKPVTSEEKPVKIDELW